MSSVMRFDEWQDSEGNPVYDSSGGPIQSKILQVVSVDKTDTFSTASTSFTTITGLTATITPSSATSKIMIMGDVKLNTSNAISGLMQARVMRDSTVIYQGDAASNRIRGNFQDSKSGGFMGAWNPLFVDSPATTSAITYSFEVLTTNSGNTLFVNRTVTDTDNTGFVRGASSITVMEVAG